MDVIRLRTMTEKSVIGFGKYTDLRVQDLLNQRKTRDLRWIYYNCSLLTFMPNILEEIGVTEEHRIEKPGKNHDLGIELNEAKKKRILGFQKLKNQSHTRRVIKANNASRRFVDHIKYSKGSLVARNHGHY